MPGITYLYRLSIALNVDLLDLLVSQENQEMDDNKKGLVVQSLDGLTNDELDLLYKSIYDSLPLTRKFKEY